MGRAREEDTRADEKHGTREGGRHAWINANRLSNNRALSIWRNGMTNGTENSRNFQKFPGNGQQVVHIFDSVPQI